MPTPQAITALTPEQSLLGGVVAALVNGIGNLPGLQAYSGESPESFGVPNVVVTDHNEEYDTDTQSDQPDKDASIDPGPRWRIATFTVECYAEGLAATEALAKQVALILKPTAVQSGVGFGNSACRIFRSGYSVGLMPARSKNNKVIAVARLRFKAVGGNMSY